MFDLGDGRKVFGVGAAEKELRAREGDFGGPLAGPEWLMPGSRREGGVPVSKKTEAIERLRGSLRATPKP